VTLDMNGAWGTLRVGRQFTPHALLFGGDIDAFQTGFAGSALLVMNGGASLISRRNAAFYQSPEIDHLSTQVMVAHDAKPAGTSSHDMDGVFWQVARRTDLFFVEGIIVDEHNFEHTAWRRLAGAGGGFDAGGIEWCGGLQYVERELGVDYLEGALGAKKHFGAHALLLSLGWSRSSGGQRGAVVVGAAYVYALDSSVNLYGSVAWLKNEPLSDIDMGVAVQPGGAAADAMVGIRFRF
jgi:predicted porin